MPTIVTPPVVVVQCMVLAHSHFDGILDSDLVSDGWDCAYVVIVKWVMWLMVWCGGVVVSVWRCGVDVVVNECELHMVLNVLLFCLLFMCVLLHFTWD